MPADVPDPSASSGADASVGGGPGTGRDYLGADGDLSADGFSRAAVSGPQVDPSRVGWLRGHGLGRLLPGGHDPGPAGEPGGDPATGDDDHDDDAAAAWALAPVAPWRAAPPRPVMPGYWEESLEQELGAHGFAVPPPAPVEQARMLGRPRRVRSWTPVLVLVLLGIAGVSLWADSLRAAPAPIAVRTPEQMTTDGYARALSASVPLVACQTDDQLFTSTAVVVRPAVGGPVLLASAHAIEACEAAGSQLLVGLPGTEPVPARLRQVDATLDVAVLAAPGLDVPALELARVPPVGDAVAVFGHAGQQRGLLSFGAVDERGSGQFVVETSVAAGQSGGPVVDVDGRVVGLVRASLTTGDGRSLAEAVPVSAVCVRLLACVL